jgi:hypothetical protein
MADRIHDRALTAVATDSLAGRLGSAPCSPAWTCGVAEAGGRIYLANDARLGQYALESRYRKLPDWRAVRARPDPRGSFQSDLGRRLGLC